MDAHFEVAAFGDAIDYPITAGGFRADGRLFVSDSGSSPSDGGIVVIEADGTTTRAPTESGFRHDRIDETTLWIIESAAPRSVRCRSDDHRTRTP